jgi:hypothetical protein
MIHVNGGLWVGALLSVLVLSTSAQANTVEANQPTTETEGKIAGEAPAESKASSSVDAEVRVPKKGNIRPEGNANPWAGGDTHDELRAFFGGN